MTIENEQIQENKQSAISNKTIQIIIAIGTSVAATCTATILLFIWNLKEEVPLLKQGQVQVEKKIDDVRGSMDALANRFTILSTEQVRQGQQINDIKEKVK